MKKSLIFLACSLLASQAFSYSIIGTDWRHIAAPRVIDYTVNDAAMPGTPSVVTDAAATWGAIDVSCYSFNKTGTNNKVALDDLTVDPLDGNDIFYAGTDGTALAVTQSWSYNSAPGEMIEFNMQVFTNYTWYTGAGTPPGGEYDLESVVLHELGHALGLGHSGVGAAVMSPTIGAGMSLRNLHTDDLDGFESIYDCVPAVDDCVWFDYWTTEGGITSFAPFPLPSGSGTFTKVAYQINPAADGTLETLRAQFYNTNDAAEPHAGTFRVHVYSDTSGAPDAILAGPLDLDAGLFTAAFGAWDVVDLTPLAYNCTAGVPFHVVWEFLPATPGTDVLEPLFTTAPQGTTQMYNSTTVAWGWWFTDGGNVAQEVEVCYLSTPPGNIALSPSFLDLGRVENGMDLSGTFYAINDGQMDAMVNSVSVGNMAYFSASAAGLPATVAPGDSVEVTVTFNSGVDTLFRDTTSVFVDWGTARDVAVFSTIAGSSECESLTNDWNGAPDELDWFVSAAGDTNILGGSWFLFGGGFNRPTPFVGHPYTAMGDTAASEIYTFVDNAGLDNLVWSFANTQEFPTDTREHFLFVYGVENDTLNFEYGFDISDTTFWQSAPAWSHINATLDSLPDSVAVSFFYGGEFGDSWYLDDVEICRIPGACQAIDINIVNAAGNTVDVTWTPFAGEVVRILESSMPYDFTGAAVAFAPSEDGAVNFDADPGKMFYRAVVDCDFVPPVSSSTDLQKIHQQPGEQKVRLASQLQPVLPVNSSDRSGSTPVLPVAARRISQNR